jgi:hypothetical protein
MRLPPVRSRWKRQVQQSPGRTRVYHISNPRLLLRGNQPPSIDSNPLQTPEPIYVRSDETWRGHFGTNHNPNNNNNNNNFNNPFHELRNRPSENIPLYNQPPSAQSSHSLPMNKSSSSDNLQWPVMQAQNIADAPLSQYDNSGYVRRPVTYDRSYNFGPISQYPSRPESEEPLPGKYSYDPAPRHQSEYPYYVRSQQQATPRPSESLPFSEEEYDPWAFSKIYGRNRTNTINNYNQQQDSVQPVPNQWQAGLAPSADPIYSSAQPQIYSHSPTPIPSTTKRVNIEATPPSPVHRNFLPAKREGSHIVNIAAQYAFLLFLYIILQHWHNSLLQFGSNNCQLD